VRPITTAAATQANYGDNPYGSLGPSPGTVAKINALPTAAGGLGIAPAGPVVTPGTPGHWSDPIDYASMIPGDWQVTDAQAQGNKLTGEAEAAFQKSLRQAFIDYGGDSSKLGDYAKYIDQPTIDAAQANKFSTVAQNLAAMTKSLRQQRAALAARGIGSSGANTEMTRQALTAKEAADYQGMRSFLSGADQGTANLATVRAQIADKIASARQAAADRLAQEYQQSWIPPTEETTTPGAPPTAFASQVPQKAAQPFGGVSYIDNLPNGGTVTTYANGRKVQQMPGKSAYVIAQGR
jgi:hypothetical protein